MTKKKTNKKITRKFKKKRRPRTKNYYFTALHENAIIQYTKTNSKKKKTKLYTELIQPAFHEMVEKIVLTYRFNSLPNIEVLKEECKTSLVLILDKFDPTRGFKAFSYFSVVTKNWYIQQAKKNHKKAQKEAPYDVITPEVEENILTDRTSYETKRTDVEFWRALLTEVPYWVEHTTNEDEKKVIQAIKMLLDNIDKIDLFSRRAVFLYIREITGIKTTKIAQIISKFRDMYHEFRNAWDDGDI